jgi:hypothetical protein
MTPYDFKFDLGHGDIAFSSTGTFSADTSLIVMCMRDDARSSTKAGVPSEAALSPVAAYMVMMDGPWVPPPASMTRKI